MKKTYTLMTVVMMMAAMSLSLVSCMDDDEYEAYTLDGAWEGNMGVVLDGYAADYSTIYFDKDPYRYASGDGYQTDYFSNSSPWYHHASRSYYVANRIHWTVQGGVIKIHYLDEDVYAEIRDYDLSYGYFEGYIDYEDGSSSSFRLRKTSAPSNWNSYFEWGYDYYSWSKKAVMDTAETRAVEHADSIAKPKRTAVGKAENVK